jgi:type III secretory pathway component EscR
MHNRQQRDNVQTLFGVNQIPSDAQIRNILDLLSVTVLIPIFLWLYHTLRNEKAA